MTTVVGVLSRGLLVGLRYLLISVGGGPVSRLLVAEMPKAFARVPPWQMLLSGRPRTTSCFVGRDCPHPLPLSQRGEGSRWTPAKYD
jgi:hypothetical protein